MAESLRLAHNVLQTEQVEKAMHEASAASLGEEDLSDKEGDAVNTIRKTKMITSQSNVVYSTCSEKQWTQHCFLLIAQSISCTFLGCAYK